MAETFKIDGMGAVAEHERLYLETDGAIGHHVDLSVMGGPTDAPCVLLKTKGRRSGEWKTAPLIYGADGDDVVIIASKGGAPTHPVWFLNIEADPQVRYQVKDKKYRGRARVAEGAERQRLWAMMRKIYPPFDDYQVSAGDRVIPLVVIAPEGEIDKI